MKHFVQYHNSERMGEPCHELNDFSIVTGKAVENLEGSRVWLICGEGTPRRYFLRQTFTVSESGPSESGSFQYFARGEEGQLFDPPLEMDRDDPWFQDFFKRNGRFGFGLQPLRPEDVDHLAKLAGS